MGELPNSWTPQNDTKPGMTPNPRSTTFYSLIEYQHGGGNMAPTRGRQRLTSLDQPAPFASLFSRGVPLHLHTGRAPSRGRSTRPCLPAVSSAVSHLGSSFLLHHSSRHSPHCVRSASPWMPTFSYLLVQPLCCHRCLHIIPNSRYSLPPSR